MGEIEVSSTRRSISAVSTGRTVITLIVSVVMVIDCSVVGVDDDGGDGVEEEEGREELMIDTAVVGERSLFLWMG